ncbi:MULTISPECIES: TIR domain-containing protein [unclassified Gordonia (in: high G+C Gram-positive bacteria)]|uniref:TIR domain-containing protein n=1 Tax=unclassified Gordonia (in: high G+C Gram-positive bacteria) TaxID=2657482 RepID=UPI001CFAD2F9|nr:MULTISPECIES: TIR domain-containing protein [unclassified Gordonia (in: high G+C Gram-positive bacteria)]MCT1353846.1 TIR domain-containing protein [Gordonia sp. p3-SID1431]UCZ91274.1 TIR domain-containing protein [Gordonia sp. WA4-43]
MPTDKTVFVSWSGELAKAVAQVIQEWLPTLVDDIEPWASSTSIQAGMGWLHEVNTKLTAAQFGIVVVTLENKDREWLNFEAGALGQRFVNDERGRVVPVMVDFTNTSDLPSTLSQFQAIHLEKEGLRSLARSLARALEKNEAPVTERFENSWPSLERKLSKAKATPSATPARSHQTKVDEILEIVRNEAKNNATLAHAEARDEIAARIIASANIHSIRFYGLSETQYTNMVLEIKDGQNFTEQEIQIYERALSAVWNAPYRIITHSEAATSPLLDAVRERTHR